MPDDIQSESFEICFNNLTTKWGMNRKTDQQRLQRLSNIFNKEVVKTFHKILYDFHHNNLYFARSELTIKEEKTPPPSIKEKNFDKNYNDVKSAIDNNVNKGKLTPQVKGYLDQLKNIHDSLFRHLNASKQYSECHDSRTKSQQNP